MFVRSQIDFGGILDEITANIPRQYLPVLIYACGLIAALPYLKLADGELNILSLGGFTTLLIVGAALPFVGLAITGLKSAFGWSYFWVWALIIYCNLPIITHLFAHLCGDIFGLTALSATLHWWRWHTLWVPHAVSLVYLSGLLAWHKVRG